MMTDPIADMLTRIRNAVMVKATDVVMPYSKLKASIAEVLVKQGFITSWEQRGEEPKTELQLTLKYQGTRPAITALKRISKPGRRMYAKNGALPVVLNNFGVAILSTSQGLLTNKEAAKLKIGGEIICEIY
ncbi:MAG: 30S ribosomal protein S8 [Patescibacteria group bacterium]